MSFSKFIIALMNGTLRGEIIGRDEFDGILVDTCWTSDTSWYETYISTPEASAVVEKYPNKEEAIKGHKKWVKIMKENPNTEIKEHLNAVDWAFGNY